MKPGALHLSGLMTVILNVVRCQLGLRLARHGEICDLTRRVCLPPRLGNYGDSEKSSTTLGSLYSIMYNCGAKARTSVGISVQDVEM